MEPAFARRGGIPIGVGELEVPFNPAFAGNVCQRTRRRTRIALAKSESKGGSGHLACWRWAFSFDRVLYGA